MTANEQMQQIRNRIRIWVDGVGRRTQVWRSGFQSALVETLVLNLPALKNPLVILKLAQRMPCYLISLPTHPTTLLNYIEIAQYNTT